MEEKSKRLIMRKLSLLLMLLSPLPLLAGSVDVRQETVEGMAVGTVNDNFRRLSKDKLDKRAVQKLIETSSTSGTLSTLSGMKNRIINGDMRIDQRNAGVAVTVNAAATFFSVDRFSGDGENADGVFTLAQDTTTVPDGFRYSVKATVTTADASVGAAQSYSLRQVIEGYNIADAGFGTSWAKPITVSFWVRSSVTGDFPISFRNSAADRSYVTHYTISSANTWEKKEITFTADTTGTWETTTSAGLRVGWYFGSGSDYLASAENTWAGETDISYSGATHLISTLNATWYITGVQVELGDTATAFEQRSVGTELELCQRYYEVVGNGCSGVWYSATNAQIGCQFSVSKRAAPTLGLLTTTPVIGEPGVAPRTGSGSTLSAAGGATTRGFSANIGGFSSATAQNAAILYTDSISASSEL